MSNLSDYLTQNGIRQEEFAARIGVTQATVSRLKDRLIKPSIKVAADIERETGGAIPAASWADCPDTGAGQ
jgi:transcriptional regulator with XRE-family HTH domain